MTTMTVEQILAANKAAMAEAQGVASAALAGFEKLVALNMAATKSALFDTSADFMSAFTAQSPSDALAAQASLVKPLAEKTVAYSRSVYAIATEASAELTKAAEAKAAARIEKRNAAKGKAPPAKAPRGDANKISARTTRTAAKK